MGILQAGAAEVDITPALGSYLAGSFEDRQARDIDDPLKAKALVIDDGDKQVVMVILDLLAISRPEVERMRQLIQEATRHSPEHVLIACTHTHTGPITSISHHGRDEKYLSWVVRRVSDCIQMAHRRLRPARLGWGQGGGIRHKLLSAIPDARRHGTYEPGTGQSECSGAHKPHRSGGRRPLHRRRTGAPIAVVAQFSLHYVGTDDLLSVSADYYGHFDRFMRRMLGSSCLPMLFNGTSGQINNVNVFDKNQEKEAIVRPLRVKRQTLGGECSKCWTESTSLMMPPRGPRAWMSSCLAGKSPPRIWSLAGAIIAGKRSES